tara:strand:- start:3128 stop:3313 length:186 start_codon:yes stop_codon:yes gene_type:complete
MKYYYTVEQRTMMGWTEVAAFTEEFNAQKHEAEFNVGSMVNPTRIQKKEFLDYMYEDDYNE